jgi:hypothetical protein
MSARAATRTAEALAPSAPPPQPATPLDVFAAGALAGLLGAAMLAERARRLPN